MIAFRSARSRVGFGRRVLPPQLVADRISHLCRPFSSTLRPVFDIGLLAWLDTELGGPLDAPDFLPSGSVIKVADAPGRYFVIPDICSRPS